MTNVHRVVSIRRRHDDREWFPGGFWLKSPRFFPLLVDFGLKFLRLVLFVHTFDYNRNMRILGIDPGYGRLGWGVVEGESMIAYGCLETKKGLSEERRLGLLFDQLKQVIAKHKPMVVAVEKLFFSKNQTTAMAVAQSRGLVLLTAAQANLPVFSYGPMEVKMAVTGYGKADKKQVAQMIKATLKLEAIPKPDDAADALAIALTHLYTRR